jgi:hypothetical protein
MLRQAVGERCHSAGSFFLDEPKNLEKMLLNLNEKKKKSAVKPAIRI